MRKSTKKILALATATVMAGGMLSLAGCGTKFHLPKEIPTGDVSSNGGFVVTMGDYYYFINGVETYTSDNTYGTPVKGSLSRVKKTDGKWGEAEIVIPSLMVAGSYGGGLFIYGDRVYYATPTNVKSVSDGTVQNAHLDFMSATLNGADRRMHVRVSANATDYRFVEENGTVYLVYYDSTATELHSYNTQSGKNTVLAAGLAAAPVFHKTEKGATTIYYTMTVTDRADSENPKQYDKFYNQIYRVEASATESAYDYTWDQAWLDEKNEGKAPYTNLGELVLDGIGFNQENTQFNHGEATPSTPEGYNYTIRAYENGGLYFTRNETAGASDALYYLSEETMSASDWDSIGGNGKLDIVANSINLTSKATTSALYYLDAEGHHYLYVNDGFIYRTDADKEGGIENEIYIAEGVSGASLVGLDGVEAGDGYGYVYYTLTANGNLTINRAVYDNAEHNIEQYYYTNLEDANFPYKDIYQARSILKVSHYSGWYNFEIIGNDIFFVDTESAAYGSSLNYVSVVGLENAAGKLMNNAELKAFNEKYEEIVGSEGLLEDIKEEQEENLLADAIKYYFYTGDRTLFDENVKEYRDAIEAGEDIELPYSEAQIAAFEAYVNGETLSYNGNEYNLKDEANASYRTRSYFVTRLGEMSEADGETYNNYWKTNVLSHYNPPAKEESAGIAGWKVALIVVACVIVAAAAAAVVLIMFKKRKKANEPKKQRMHVDTTDDRDIDVYAEEEVPMPEKELAEEPVSEETEAPAEEPATEEPVAPDAE